MKSFLAAVLMSLALCAASAAADVAAFVPSNPPAMKPLANQHSPAHDAAQRFMRGVNLGDYLEAPPEWSRKINCPAGDFALMRAEGFDHVRVPIGWHHYTGAGPDYAISPEIFARADFVVTNALASGLAVLINIHHFDAFTTDPAAQTDKFLAIWRQLAAHYAAFSNTLAFELLNEPKDAASTAVMNPIYAQAIAVIHRTNPRRTIFVGPGRWNNIEELNHLVLPAEDDNLVVSVHCYDPFYFTHQGATWAGNDTKVTGIEFPGPPAKPLVPDPALKLNPWVLTWVERYNTLPAATNPCSPGVFEDKLKFAKAWSDHFGRPVHVGEFGCFVTADPESRARFYAAFRRALDNQGLGWAIWDWSANFRYWDRKQNAPMPGMRPALFQ